MTKHWLTPYMDDMARFEEFLEDVEGTQAPNTEIGYTCDFKIFIRWCQERGFSALPANDKTVADFVNDQSTIKCWATIDRYVSAIAFFHKNLDYPNPRFGRKTSNAMKRMKRRNRAPQKQATPLREEDVTRMVECAPRDLKGLRDIALVTTAYDSMFRREELSRIEVDDLIADDSGGATLDISYSKGDQEGEGAEVYLRPATYCYVLAWLEVTGITEGPIFRTLRKGFELTAPLRPADVAAVFKGLAEAADLPATGISGHSTRVGAAIDLAVKGVSMPLIMRKGRWTSEKMVMRYIRRVTAAQIGRETTGRDSWTPYT